MTADSLPRVNFCCALHQDSPYVRALLGQVRGLLEKTYVLGAVVIVVDGEEVRSPLLLEAARADARIKLVPEGPRGPAADTMEQRAVEWARVANLALEESLRHPSDRTLWMEADLAFPCDIIDLLLAPDVDIVAPRILLGDIFYDSWGFRSLKGEKMRLDKMLYAQPRRAPDLVELSSVGSCLLLRTEILRRGVRLPGRYTDGLLVGFCLDAGKLGYRTHCLLSAAVIHPRLLWAEQQHAVTGVFFTGADGRTVEQSYAQGLTVVGPYVEFLGELVQKPVRRDSLSARLRIGPPATFCFITKPGRRLSVHIRVGGPAHEGLVAGPGERLSGSYPVRLEPIGAGWLRRLESVWKKLTGGRS